MLPCPSPVLATLFGPVSACTVAWRMRGALYLTVVVKATFALVAEGRMSLVEPDSIAAGEQPHRSGAGLRTAGDLAPFLGQPEVWLTGHAPVPPNVPRAQRSFQVGLTVVQGGVPRAARQIQLDAARALGNPPVVAVTGMGPNAADWPVRRRWLEGLDVRSRPGPVLEIPDALSAEYFQTAPVEQRLDALRGDDTLVLDGMSARHPRLRTQLPTAWAVARLYRKTSPAPRAGESVPLRADTLQVDVDRLRCSLVWRGRAQLASEAEMASLRLVAGLNQAGEAPAWVDPFEAEEAQSRMAAGVASGATLWFDDAWLTPELAAKMEALLPPRAPKAPPAEVPFSSTAHLSIEDLGEIAQKFATPFEKAEKGVHRAALPVPAPPANAPRANAPLASAPRAALEMPFSGTLGLSEEALRQVAEKAATPFEVPASKGSPAAALTPPVPPVSAGPPAPPAEPAFSTTLGLSAEVQAMIARQANLPFNEGGAPSPAVAQSSGPKVRAPSSPRAPSADSPFSSTLGISFGEQVKLAELSATPFDAPPRPTAPSRELALPEPSQPVWTGLPLPAPRVSSPLPARVESPASRAASPAATIAKADPLLEIEMEPVEPGGLGAEFLAALEEAGALA